MTYSLLLASVSLLGLVGKILYSRLELIAEKTKLNWDNVVISSLKTPPISSLIWLWPATVSIGLILQSYVNHTLDWLSTLKILLVIVIFIWITIRLVNNIEEQFLKEKKAR